MRTQDSKPYPEKGGFSAANFKLAIAPRKTSASSRFQPPQVNKECWDDSQLRVVPFSNSFRASPGWCISKQRHRQRKNAPRIVSFGSTRNAARKLRCRHRVNYPASRRHIPCPNAIQPSRQRTDAPKARSLALLGAGRGLRAHKNTESPPAIPTRRKLHVDNAKKKRSMATLQTKF